MPSDESQAAFGHFPQMKPRRSKKSDIGNKLYESVFIPQDELDVALMLLPYGKAGRLAAAAALGLTSQDAEAGKLKTAVKSLQQMRDELMLKGAFDPSRRSLFGLQPTQDMAGRELAKVERQAAKEGQAPTIVKSTTSVSPDAGKTSKTVEKILETPVSRRQVLQSAASQAVQGALPKGALPTPLTGVEDLMGQAARAAAPAVPSFTSPIAYAASLLKSGKPVDEIETALGNVGMFKGKYDPGYMEAVTDIMRGPEEWLTSEYKGLTRPSAYLGRMLNPDPFEDLGAIHLRPYMRELKTANPEMYSRLINTARDASMMTAEQAAELGLSQKWIDKFMKGQSEFHELPQQYQNKVDDLMNGFGDYD